MTYPSMYIPTVAVRSMQLAIEAARTGVAQGHRPFGCVITDPFGNAVATTYGTESECDPTRHSEMLAIREACRQKGGLLQGYVLYSTHEPCAMCAGAICHAKLSRVVFGSHREDLPLLFRPKPYARLIYQETKDPPVLTPGFMNSECVALFDDEVAEAHRKLDRMRRDYA